MNHVQSVAANRHFARAVSARLPYSENFTSGSCSSQIRGRSSLEFQRSHDTRVAATTAFFKQQALLYLFGAIFNSIALFTGSGKEILANGFFHGYNRYAVVVIVLMSSPWKVLVTRI